VGTLPDGQSNQAGDWTSMIHHRSSTLTHIVLVLLPAIAAATDSPPILELPFRFSSRAPSVWSTLSAPALGEAGSTASAPRVRTVPTFEDTFTYAGQTYSYVMVGTDPRLSSRRTVVPAVIVPLRFAFADGGKFDPGKTIAQLRRSPIFRHSTFSSGTTQYGDAIQRAEFWTYTQTTPYHVLLRHPAVTAKVLVRVPASDGITVVSPRGGRVGLVTESFLLQQVVPAVINQLRLPPTKLIVLMSHDVELRPPAGESGVILGEHSSGTDRSHTRIWTFAWASWNTLDVVPEEDADVAALSHEIAEWYNDPFGVNAVPSWEAPPSYPCNPLLEVGDPLAGTTFVQDGYHLQDAAFLSWFARQVPSIGMDGRYSFLGTLTAPPPVCSGP
jgi:hypothetical protein